MDRRLDDGRNVGCERFGLFLGPANLARGALEGHLHFLAGAWVIKSRGSVDEGDGGRGDPKRCGLVTVFFDPFGQIRGDLHRIRR